MVHLYPAPPPSPPPLALPSQSRRPAVPRRLVYLAGPTRRATRCGRRDLAPAPGFPCGRERLRAALPERCVAPAGSTPFLFEAKLGANNNGWSQFELNGWSWQVSVPRLVSNRVLAGFLFPAGLDQQCSMSLVWTSYPGGGFDNPHPLEFCLLVFAPEASVQRGSRG